MMRFLESRNFNLTNFNPPSLKCFLHIYDRCLVFNCFETLNCEKKIVCSCWHLGNHHIYSSFLRTPPREYSLRNGVYDGAAHKI